MKTWETIRISEEDYNTVLFDIVCEILEENYGYSDAQIMMQKKGFWTWARIQRDIVDSNFCKAVEQLSKSKTFKAYRNTLWAHFQTVYFPERLEKQFKQKNQ